MRFSQAISEGDGISLIVDVADADAARTAADQGAEAVTVRSAIAGLRDAVELPILWRGPRPPPPAAAAGGGAGVVQGARRGEGGHPPPPRHSGAGGRRPGCVVGGDKEEKAQRALR